MRIWAKAMKGGKIRKQFVYERDGKVVYSQFFTYLSEICAALDVPTPVLLKTHIFNFAKFNHVNFLPRDFVESFPYDKLVLENIFYPAGERARRLSVQAKPVRRGRREK